ncbi:MAG: hypothetical protein AAFR61_01400 [Bacteroidota bacterium]
MDVRILHCSNLLENYYTCINEKVAGFSNRAPQKGDLIYLVVKVGKVSYCGARFILDEITDYRPWKDGDKYIHSLSINDIEFCTPFDVSILSEVGGKYWGIKFMQGSKPIKELRAIGLLDNAFSSQKIPDQHIFSIDFEEEPLEEEIIISEKEAERIVKAIPDAKIRIMGTFQTINFQNETDKLRGLEVLVNDNFYHLFPQFPKEKTILIPENRLFKTKGKKNNGANIQGIRTIPDGLLIRFSKSAKTPFQINLIEYECYGEKKTRASDKSYYLNSQIIPQLMRFASAFSIITDDKTRESTINEWVDKTIDYINGEEQLSTKMISWVKELNPSIKERSIDRECEKLLIQAFKFNVKVLLIIDELSTEQKETIRNVIRSFKLVTGDSVQFEGHVIKLVQRLSQTDHESEYALTVQ